MNNFSVLCLILGILSLIFGFVIESELWAAVLKYLTIVFFLGFLFCAIAGSGEEH